MKTRKSAGLVLSMGAGVLLAGMLLVSPAGAASQSEFAELGVIGHSPPPRSGAIVPVSRRVEALVPIPAGGVHIDLWSDPPAGSIVRPGAKANIRFRANADCYVTVISVDTEGRVRLLFPAPFEDGRVRGDRTYRLPARRGQDLVFTGPPGQEYVYALASVHPVHHRYPHWLVDGRVWEVDPWSDEYEYDDLYLTGFVIGDPHYRIRVFCRDLVTYPEWPDSYATAYLYFNVARRVSYPRYVCSDCHYTRPYDPYGHTCSAVRIRFGQIRTSGWIDFRVSFVPVYRYEVSPGWRPRTWRGSTWRGPDGRWVWSSADGRDRIRKNFADASPPKGGPGRVEDGRAVGSPDPRGGRSVDKPADRGWRDADRPADRGRSDSDKPADRGGRDTGKPADRGGRDSDKPADRGGRNAWQRAHEERLESSVRGREGTPHRDPTPARANEGREEIRKEPRANPDERSAPGRAPEARPRQEPATNDPASKPETRSDAPRQEKPRTSAEKKPEARQNVKPGKPDPKAKAKPDARTSSERPPARPAR